MSDSDVMKLVSDYARRCESNGQYPYEGQWLTKDEIHDRIRQKKRSAMIHSVELVLLFFSTYLFAALVLRFIALLNY